jgi:hypothetical protein
MSEDPRNRTEDGNEGGGTAGSGPAGSLRPKELGDAAPASIVAGQLGHRQGHRRHSGTQVTMTYMHAAQEEQRKALRSIGERLA